MKIKIDRQLTGLGLPIPTTQALILATSARRPIKLNKTMEKDQLKANVEEMHQYFVANTIDSEDSTSLVF